MSAFLGPIHYWLYNKIGNQEELTREIADYAADENLIDDAEKYTKRLPRLETVIDEGNIHLWLQNCISDAEKRYADLVGEIISNDCEKLKELEKVAFEFGKKHSICCDDAAEIYKSFEDFFGNGMPCDRINTVTESFSDKVSWEMTQDIHFNYWDKDSEPYYVLRKKVMDGMLAESDFKVEMFDKAHYMIIKK